MRFADHSLATRDRALRLIVEWCATEESPEIVSLEQWQSERSGRAEFPCRLVDPRQQRALLDIERLDEEDDPRLARLTHVQQRGTERVPADQMRAALDLLRQVQQCQVMGERVPDSLLFKLATLRFKTDLPLETSLL